MRHRSHQVNEAIPRRNSRLLLVSRRMPGLSFRASVPLCERLAGRLEPAADGGGAGEAGMVIAFAQHGRLLVLLAAADIDQLQRQLVIALIVAVLARRAAGQLGE